jgi:hypothetical protein
MLAWRVIAMQQGLTPVEIVSLAASFCGLSIPDCLLTLEGQSEMIEVAGRIVATSCIGKNAVAGGYGVPLKGSPNHNERS